MKTTFISCLSILMCILSTSCVSPSINTIENADKTMNTNTIYDSRFVTDDVLAKRLALTKLDAAYTTEGHLRIQLEAINVIHKPTHLRYKIAWFNKDGFEMRTILSDWQNATVLPGGTLYIQSIAPQKDCADFRINLIDLR